MTELLTENSSLGLGGGGDGGSQLNDNASNFTTQFLSRLRQGNDRVGGGYYRAVEASDYVIRI